MAADHAFDQTLVREAVHALGLLVANAQGVHHRELARGLRGEKARLHGFEQMRGFHQAATAAHQAHGVVVFDEVRRVGSGHEFALCHGVHRFTSNSAAPFFNALLAITPRWISLVPSKMR